jgi:uncharacterized protein YbaP (TraB family)
MAQNSKKRRQGIIAPLLAGLLCLAAANPAGAAGAPNFLWQVQAKGKTVFLLGSIHVLKKDIYPLSKTIEDAFAKSDVLAVEANVNALSGIDAERIMLSAVYTDENNLVQHVSPATLALVKKEAAGLGLPPVVVVQQKPWFLGMTLQSLALLQAGYDPEYGIDKHFLTKATGKKKILELEGIDEQIDLLAGLNDQEQELFLLYTINDLKQAVKEADQVVEAWRAGAVKRLETIIDQNALPDQRFKPIYEKLVIKRNKKMAALIENYLKSNDTCFVVLGAAHLIGKEGIVQLLKDKGYQVEQR